MTPAPVDNFLLDYAQCAGSAKEMSGTAGATNATPPLTATPVEEVNWL